MLRDFKRVLEWEGSSRVVKMSHLWATGCQDVSSFGS